MLAAMSTPEIGSDDMRTAVVTLLARAESLNQGARSRCTRWSPRRTAAGRPN